MPRYASPRFSSLTSVRRIAEQRPWFEKQQLEKQRERLARQHTSARTNGSVRGTPSSAMAASASGSSRAMASSARSQQEDNFRVVAYDEPQKGQAIGPPRTYVRGCVPSPYSCHEPASASRALREAQGAHASCYASTSVDWMPANIHALSSHVGACCWADGGQSQTQDLWRDAEKSMGLLPGQGSVPRASTAGGQHDLRHMPPRAQEQTTEVARYGRILREYERTAELERLQTIRRQRVVWQASARQQRATGGRTTLTESERRKARQRLYGGSSKPSASQRAAAAYTAAWQPPQSGPNRAEVTAGSPIDTPSVRLPSELTSAWYSAAHAPWSVHHAVCV